jgi:type II secretory pathway component PulJ
MTDQSELTERREKLSKAVAQLEATLRRRGIAFQPRGTSEDMLEDFELLEAHAAQLVELGNGLKPAQGQHLTATQRSIAARSQTAPPAKPCGLTATQKVLAAKGLTSLDQLSK